MKSRDGHARLTVLAALLIIGCSFSSMRRCCRRRAGQRHQLDDAVQTWEAEGGAVIAEQDEEDNPAAALVR